MSTTNTALTTCASIGPSTKPSTSSSSRERAVWQTHVRGADQIEMPVMLFHRPSKAATPTTFSSSSTTYMTSSNTTTCAENDGSRLPFVGTALHAWPIRHRSTACLAGHGGHNPCHRLLELATEPRSDDDSNQHRRRRVGGSDGGTLLPSLESEKAIPGRQDMAAELHSP
jgi:hypothetical protein